MRRAAVLVSLLIACRGPVEESPGPEVVTGPTTPPSASCPRTHAADGPACAPTFDACGEHEIAKLGGGCEPVGIAACAQGLVSDGRGGCRAVLPAAPCEPGSIALPGMSACEPIAPCAAVEGATLFVDAAASGGDGSRDKPFARIGEAISRAEGGAVIAIAAGTYAEDVTIDKAIRVVGVCPSKVTIKGLVAEQAVAITAAAKLERVSVTGDAMGINVLSDGVVDSVRVFGATVRYGIRIGNRSTSIVRRSVVEGVRTFGILVSGSKGRVEGCHVLGTREDEVSIGVRVNPDPTTLTPGEMTVVGSLIEKNEYANAEAVSSTMLIESSVLRDGVAVGGKFGVGARSARNDTVKIPGDVTLRDSILENNSYLGASTIDSRMVLERTVVRGTKPAGKTYGRGLVAQGLLVPTTLIVRSSVVEDNHETGIDVNGQASATIAQTIVRGTRANGTGVFGETIERKGPVPRIEIDRSLLIGNEKAGAITAGVLTIRASRIVSNQSFGLGSRGGVVTVAGTLIEQSPLHGSLNLFDRVIARDPQLTVEDSAIRNVAMGVGIYGGRATIARSVLRDLQGAGVSVQSRRPDDSTALTLESSLISSVAGAGVLVTGAPAKLHNVHIREVRLAPDGGFGDGLLVSGLYFVGPGLRTSSIELTGSWIERGARTGIALFGSSLVMGSSFLTCNTLPLDVEAIGGWDGTGYVAHPFAIDDRGGNVCGCNTAGPCVARSTNLTPAQPIEAPAL